MNPNDCTTEAPVFVVGMPRSGTTLISAILSRHSHISIAPETHFIAHDWRINQAICLDNDDELQSFWKEFVSGKWFKSLQLEESETYAELSNLHPRTFAKVFCTILKKHTKQQGKSRWGEKTPGHYHHIDILLDWYPNARIIFMVRDPRAVVASLLLTPWSNNYSSFHALRWKECFHILKSWSSDGRVLILKYEDLVSSPELTAKKLFKYLDETYEENVLTHDKEVVVMTRDDWGNEHLKNAQSEVNATSLEKWRENLSCYQLNVIEMVNQQEMRELGYAASHNSYSLKTIALFRMERFISRLHLGLARNYRVLRHNISAH